MYTTYISSQASDKNSVDDFLSIRNRYLGKESLISINEGRKRDPRSTHEVYARLVGCIKAINYM